MRLPTATYRIQFRNGMDFDAAVEVVPYLSKLGVSHLYASPIFTAPHGSTHGYDVANHNEIDLALGGREGFERLSDALKAAGLGLILDIVPNHMAASVENSWWSDVLEWGDDSAFARHFDIDWSRRLTLPILGADYGEALEAGDLQLQLDEDAGRLVLRYFDNKLPLHPASWSQLLPTIRHPLARSLIERAERASADQTRSFHDDVRSLVSSPEAKGLKEEIGRCAQNHDTVDALHRSQAWELIFWRDARKNLSYRRFFEVTGLVGVRVEDDVVFEDVHRLTLELVRSGHIDGLRIDHVDGLADPLAYLRRLRGEVGPDVFLVVEKILSEGEQLPPEWPVQGTTGYEFIDAMADLLAEPKGVAALSRAYGETTGAPETGELRQASKTQIVSVNFEGEVEALTRLFRAAGQTHGFDLADLRPALKQLIVAMPVYRVYGRGSDVGERDRQVLGQARSDALRAMQAVNIEALDFIHDLLAGDHPAARTPAGRLAQERFQQLTGPAMAKGVEDTLFYRDNRFIAFNEVGCDIERPPPSLERFHRAMEERCLLARSALTTTATHDTKRGEDARARLLALSEMPRAWMDQLAHWRKRYEDRIEALPDGPAPEPTVEWLIFQALVGCWPTDTEGSVEDDGARLRERFLSYLEKAMREAKQRTDWGDVDARYEEAVKDYARPLLDRAEPFWAEMSACMNRLALAGWRNSLKQTTVKLLAPGIPDIYQGSELGDFSLVDPDNRRPVDFGACARMLGNGERQVVSLPAAKQALVARLLQLRNAHRELFAEGSYIRIEIAGPKRDHLVGFGRSHNGKSLIAVAPRLTLGLIDDQGSIPAEVWKGTRLVLPPKQRGEVLRDVFSQNTKVGEMELDVSELLANSYVGVFVSS